MSTFMKPHVKIRRKKKKAHVKLKHSKVHPGFQAEQAKIAEKEGVSKEAAGAILANATRNASPMAKHANPFLKRVKG